MFKVIFAETYHDSENCCRIAYRESSILITINANFFCLYDGNDIKWSNKLTGRNNARKCVKAVVCDSVDLKYCQNIFHLLEAYHKQDRYNKTPV